MKIAKSTMTRLSALSRHWRSALLAGRSGRRPGVLVCRASEGVVYGAYMARRNGRADRRSFTWSSPKQAAESLSLRQLPKGCRIVALLPKSHYLIKVLQIPAVSPEQVASILALEAQALVPVEFGEAEVSYRQLPAEGQAQTTRKYEVYISRSDELNRYLSSLDDLGIQPDLILPSAVVWGRILDSAGAPDMLVVGSDRDGLREAASIQSDGSLSVRILNGTADGGSSGTIDQALMEIMRSSLANYDIEDSPLTIGWADGQMPAGSGDGKIVFKSIGDLIPGTDREAPASQDGEALVSLAATVLSEISGDSFLSQANLLPRELLASRSWKAITRRMATGAAAMLMGLLLAYAALGVSAARYRAIGDELSDKTAIIETEGKAIGRRIRQLEAVNAAISTQGRFADLIAGLYEATPDGVTYSNAELTSTGDIRLQGQAESISLPFLLPQRLEAQRCFKNVSLRDAGQVKRAGGSIAQFRIDCRLAGSGGRR